MWTMGICGDGLAILKDGTMVPVDEVIDALNTALSLEKQYAERLGRLAQLCGVVIPAVRYTYLELGGRPDPEVISAMCEIMDYVDAVRP